MTSAANHLIPPLFRQKARWSDKLLAAKVALACKDVVWGTYLEQWEEEKVEDEMAKAALEVIQKWRVNG